MDFDHSSSILSNVATVDLGSLSLTFSGNAAIILPSGTTATRPVSPSVGMLRYNTTTGMIEYRDNSTWSSPIKNLSQCADVSVSSITSGQVLMFNGATWSNTTIASAPSSFTGTISSWTLSSGNIYYADVAHGLGTRSIVVSLYDTVTNELTEAHRIVATTTSTVRIYVYGNTATLRCVIVANGQAMVAGVNIPSSISLQQSGGPVAGTPHSTLNFTGSGVTVTDAGGGVATVAINPQILRTLTYYATSFDIPNNTNWAVNSIAPTVADPANNAINVRQFSNTTENGVGMMITVPANATNITFRIKGRPATAPASTAAVQHKLYFRSIPNNSAVGAWSSATSMDVITIPTNAFYQYATQTYAISTLGLSANGLYQLELTRSTTVTSGTQLAYNWLLSEFTVEFT